MQERGEDHVLHVVIDSGDLACGTTPAGADVRLLAHPERFAARPAPAERSGQQMLLTARSGAAPAFLAAGEQRHDPLMLLPRDDRWRSLRALDHFAFVRAQPSIGWPQDE